MSNPYLCQIEMVGFNFAPRGFALCAGALLPIAQNTAVFSLMGTTFGGDGRTTFALPDLRGRVPKGQGTGAGLGPVSWGERGGIEDMVLTVSNLPSHNHTLRAHRGAGDTVDSQNAYLSGDSTADNTWWSGAATNLTNTNNGSILNTGGSQSFSILNPYLGLYYNIALQGIFPSRS